MLCYYLFIVVFVFFFKQKTAYEMRISDWSSDVCSSDLLKKMVRPSLRREMARTAVEGGRTCIRHACQTFEVSETCYRYQAKASEETARIADLLVRLTPTSRAWGLGLSVLYLPTDTRSRQRRVGQEGIRKGRYRRAP